MFTISKEKLALAYTHSIYRNTELEDYHSGKVEMNMALYGIIRKIVKEKIEYINVENRKLAKFKSLEALNKHIKEHPNSHTYMYVAEIYLNSIMGLDWDSPVMSEDTIINNNNLADYILKGNFLEYCEKHMRLNDAAMRYINKDVYNRVYTLVRLGLL